MEQSNFSRNNWPEELKNDYMVNLEFFNSIKKVLKENKTDINVPNLTLDELTYNIYKEILWSANL